MFVCIPRIKIFLLTMVPWWEGAGFADDKVFFSAYKVVNRGLFADRKAIF